MGKTKLTGLRVLVVEDEYLVAMGLEAMLVKLGCTVVSFASGLDEALRLARHDSLDLAVLDVKLNHKSVYPVARELATRGIPFIFTTGYARANIPKPFKTVPCLEKPFTEDDLRKQLERLFP